MARSLTKCRKDGVRYVRPQAVETEIEVTLEEDRTTLRRRLSVTDRASPEYLCSECLVHIIRDALRKEDEDLLNAAVPIVLARCEAILKTRIANSLPGADELREEVLSEFSELLASDGTGECPDELDIYECRFNMAFRALRIDVVNRELRRLDRTAELPDYGDEHKPNAYEEDAFARLSETFRTPATQQSSVFRRELWEEISALPSDERKALILCHALGYKVESADPDEVTAATRCNCTGRTIRNRLSRAVAKLSQLREEVWTPS